MGKLAIPTDRPATFEDEYREVVQQIDRAMEAPRLAQIAAARRNYLYWNGNQYLLPHFDINSRVINYKVDKPTSDDRMFRSVYNIIYSDGFKFLSVALQRGAAVKAVPDDPDDEEQVAAAKDADGAARYLHRLWNIKHIIFRMSFHQWVTGPAFLHNRFVVDPVRFGTVDVPETTVEKDVAIPEEYVCPRCVEPAAGEICERCGGPTDWMPEVALDVPRETMRQVPMGAADLKVYSVFHVAIPFEATNEKEVYHIKFAELLNKWQGRGLYDDIPDSWLANADKNTVDYEADQALEDVRSPARQYGDRDQALVRHERRHLRPEVFRAFSQSNRQYLFRNYPTGLLCVRIGDRIAEMAHENLDDHWSICPTRTGEQLTAAPLCSSIIPIQDDINNFNNLAKEVLLRNIPKTLVDSQLFSNVDINKRTLVNEVIPVNSQNGDMSKLVAQLPLSRFSDQMMPFGESLRAFSREVDNIMPAIFGGGEAAPTWRQAAQQKNQALMGLLTPFDAQHVAISRATENSVREQARSGYGKVLAPAAKQSGGMDLDAPQVLDFEGMSDTGWHVEPVETTPMTFGEKAQRIEELVKENPGMTEVIGLMHPVNMPEVQKVYGLEDFYVPGAQEREKLDRRIKRLLAEEPMMAPDPMTGAVSERSSIQPDEFADKNHQFVADYLRAWVNSPRGEKTELENPMGFRNVWLHGLEQDQAAAMQMMPSPGPAGPQGPGPQGQDQQQDQAMPQPQ